MQTKRLDVLGGNQVLLLATLMLSGRQRHLASMSNDIQKALSSAFKVFGRAS